MGLFSSIKDFFKKVFGLMRDGAQVFLNDAIPIAIEELEKLRIENKNTPLTHWEETAKTVVFKTITEKLSKKFPSIPGTWISIALYKAYDIILSGKLKDLPKK